ncbi:hypothetical protein [Natrinema gelatinilyticum]|uniref:hypothetical protein n=1 Tax=Natrinema gelatinilyticum TaxID=2961571 RepID=UPI0020C242BE|nr:hypothetical protein [Natrinema gelatinilyticum]
MAGDEEPVQQCTVAEPVDLRAALDTAAIEHLGVDDHRTIVIYQQTILMIIVTEGEATAAQAFDVELWKESPDHPNRDSEDLLTAFIDELAATTDTIRR